ncbi:MAG TPA: PspC domain-containing protein [Candidatus Limnocylindrales bacterium]|nr:PspC domain-containing protein [Candidatus Limnocylindrales bacterium]
MNRHLYRCRHDRRIAGVAAGVAEFFDLDVTLVRILWFLSIFVGGLGILLYIGLALIVPNEPLTADELAAVDAVAEPGGAVHVHAHGSSRGVGGGRATTFIGALLILVGAIALAEVVLPGVHAWRWLWPAFLVGTGAFLVAGAIRRDGDDRPDGSGSSAPNGSAPS